MSEKKASDSRAAPLNKSGGDKRVQPPEAVTGKEVIGVDEQWEIRSWNEFTAESKLRAARASVANKSKVPLTATATSSAKIVIVQKNGKNYLSIEKQYGNINREDIIYLKREADRKNWQCVLDGDLRGVDLRGLDLTAVNFSGADLREAVLIHAVCRHANFSGVDFSGADLTSGDFLQADFSGADLYGVRATCAVFSDANFRKARLTYADLRLSDLTGACLIKANLYGTKLGGATRVRAKMTLLGHVVNVVSRAVAILFPPPF